MIIYYSMFLWIVLMWVIKSLTEKTLNKKYEKTPFVFAILTFAYIIFWVGLRTAIGDTKAYIGGFQNFTSDFNSIITGDGGEKGFAVFQYIIKYFIADDFHVFLMIVAAVTGISIAVALYKHSENFFYSVFLFMTTLHFVWMLNGIRQYMVVAVLFAFSGILVKKRFYLYIILILFLSLFHSSCIVMIPVIFIARAKPWSKPVILCISIFALAAFFTTPLLDSFEFFLEDTKYQGVTETFQYDDGVNPLRVLVSAVPVLMAFLTRKKIQSMNNKYIDVCVNMSIMTMLFYFIGVFTSGIFVGRLPIYFEVYNLILLPYMFKHCFSEKEKSIIYSLCTIGYMLFFFMLTEGMYYVSDLTGFVV